MSFVRTNDGVRVHVDQNLVNSCSMLKMVTEMLDCSDEHASFEVPLPNIDSATMKIISSGKIPPFNHPRELIPLMRSADYLGYEKLVDDIAKIIARSWSGLSKKEIENFIHEY